MKVSDWIALAAAIATTAAVMVALAVAVFQEALRRWRSPPEVRLAADVGTFAVLVDQGAAQRVIHHSCASVSTCA
jgi:Co/Zn/Cd efflux system component